MLFATAASAVEYKLPGSLPADCSATSATSYSCGDLTLGWNDSIVVVNANTTLTVTKTLTIGGNEINTATPATGFALVVKKVAWNNYLHLNGDFSTDDNVNAGWSTSITGSFTTTGRLTTASATTITGSVSAKSISSGGGSTYGSMTATGGGISLGSSEQVNGSLNATGSITTGSGSTITGDVTSSGGGVTLNSSNTKVGGSVSASGDVSTGSQTSIGGAVSAKSISAGGGGSYGGNMTATGGYITLGSSDQVKGSLTAKGDITSGSSSTIGGTVTASGDVSTGSQTIIGGAVSAKSITSGGGSTYNGNLTATAGIVTLGSSDAIAGSVSAIGNITTGSANTITGDVTSSSGGVTLKSPSTKVGGSVSASGQVTLESGTQVVGSVICSNSSVVLNSSASVGGGIAASGDVTIGSSASVTGNVVSSSGGVTLKSSNAQVGGNVTASGLVTLESGTQVVGSVTSGNSNVVLNSSNAGVGKCVTVGSSHSIVLGWSASVGGVCCNTGGTCTNTCVDNASSGKPMPSLCASTGTCIVDDFSTGTLNTALWNSQAVSGSYTPAVVDVGGNKRIRLTSNAANQATMLQLKKWFPAAGNKIVVSFDYYVYDGNGADGVAVVFSDASVTPSAGGYGGSMGYAQRSYINGFGGGWLAVGLDEFGYFPAASEGRQGYPTGWKPPLGADTAAGNAKSNISVRGSGSGTTGYALLANTGVLATPLWSKSNTSATRQGFRITIDHTNSVNAYVTVERDTGSGYSTVVPQFDAKGSNSGQAAVPANWLLSFTGSTGSAYNTHEIANLSVCATYINNPGASAAAANFECLETGVLAPWSTTARKPLYTKLVDNGFRFDVVALKTDGSIQTGYVAAGGDAKTVTVELFDDSVSPAPATCSAYANPVATQSVSFVASDGGRKAVGSDFNVSSAYRKLRCRVSDKTTAASPVYGCSSDRFAVRPSAATLLTVPAMTAGPSATAAGTIKAGDAFKLRATTSTASASYSGTLTLDTGKLTAQTTAQDKTVQSGGVVGTLTPATLTANAALADATYSEVGYLYLAAGAYRDETFTAVDRSDGDCISSTDSDNNLADSLVNGKYGCDIGNKSAATFGRFIPHHFVVAPGSLVNRRVAACAMASDFSYAGEEMQLKDFTLTAYNGLATPGITQNYSGVFAARFDGSTITNFSFAAVDLADALPPTAATAFAVGGAAGQLGLVSSSGSWGSGSGAGIGTFSANVKLNRADSPDGPYESFRLGVAPVDLDGVTVLAGSKNLDVTAPADGVYDKVLIGSSKVRYGRLRLTNAFGSDRRNLAVPVEAQYWSGLSWVRNSADSCTTLPVAAVGLTGAQGKTQVASAVTLASGGGNIVLTCPYASCPLTSKPATSLAGSVGVCVDLGADPSPDATKNVVCEKTPAALPYLQGRWPPGTTYANDPSARATFGVYSPETSRTVHVREAF